PSDASRTGRGIFFGRQLKFSCDPDIVDTNQFGGSTRLLESLGNDERNCLMVVINLGPAEKFGSVVSALAERTGIFRCNNGKDASCGLGLGQVDGADASFGDG